MQLTDRDLAFTPATELAEHVRLKKVSPVELVDVYARRIEELNPKLGAYLTTTLDEARDQAKGAEEGQRRRASALPRRADLDQGSERHGRRRHDARQRCVPRPRPDTDCETVARIKRAGFIMLGKTNTPEFGTTCFTDPPGYFPARNPWDTERTTGGSSGGAAGALAAGLCPVSHGSDGGGSIRIPSSLCGSIRDQAVTRTRVACARAEQLPFTERPDRADRRRCRRIPRRHLRLRDRRRMGGAPARASVR